MDWQAALRARLVGAPAFTDLAEQRADWGIRKQGDPLSAMVLQTLAGGGQQHLKGHEGLQARRVQIDAYAKTHKRAWALMNAALGLLVPPAEVDGNRFGRAMIEREPADLPARDGVNIDEFRVSADLIFFHTDA